MKRIVVRDYHGLLFAAHALVNGDLCGCVEWVRRQAALSIVLVFCGFGRSMLFTLPLVGWVIRSILETDHVLKYHKLFGQVQWLWVFKQVAKSLEGELKLARQMP